MLSGEGHMQEGGWVVGCWSPEIRVGGEADVDDEGRPRSRRQRRRRHGGRCRPLVREAQRLRPLRVVGRRP